MAEKTYLLLENAQVVMNRPTADRFINSKCATGENWDGKEDHVIRDRRKEGPCIQWQQS